MSGSDGAMGLINDLNRAAVEKWFQDTVNAISYDSNRFMLQDPCRTRWKTVQLERLVFTGKTAGNGGSEENADVDDTEDSESTALQPTTYAFVGYTLREPEPAHFALNEEEMARNQDYAKVKPSFSARNVLFIPTRARDEERIYNSHLKKSRSEIKKLKSFSDLRDFLQAAIDEVNNAERSSSRQVGTTQDRNIKASGCFFPTLITKQELNQILFYVGLLEDYLSRHDNPMASKEKTTIFRALREVMLEAWTQVRDHTLAFY